MVFAMLILAVAIILSVQLVCSTWRDIKELEQATRLEISRNLHQR